MDDLERLTTEMILRVNRFGDENPDLISGNAVAVGNFATVVSYVGQLEAEGEERSSATERKFNQSARRRMLRDELRKDLTKISKVADDIARTNPDFEDVFNIPRRNFNDSAMLETARAFHTSASVPAVKTLLLAYALPTDFLEDLAADTNDFEDAIGRQDTANRDRIDANASIDDMLTETLRAIRTLKIVMPNLLADDRGKLADWTAASHVERPSRRARPQG